MSDVNFPAHDHELAAHPDDRELQRQWLNKLLPAAPPTDDAEEVITVRLSKPRLAALRDVINQMHEFAESCGNERGDVSDYRKYDEGMADWREDVAYAAESLIDTIAEEVVT